MKKEEKAKAVKKLDEETDISRRKAIKKMGYAAFAASTMFLLLNNPTKVHAQSPGDDNPGGPGDDWDDWG